MEFALEGLKLTACANCPHVNKVTDLEELGDGSTCDVCLEVFDNSQLVAQLPCCRLGVHAHCVADAIDYNYDLVKQCFKCRREEHDGLPLWRVFRRIYRAYRTYEEDVEELLSSEVAIQGAETVLTNQQDDQSDKTAVEQPVPPATRGRSLGQIPAVTDALVSQIPDPRSRIVDEQQPVHRDSVPAH